MHRSAVSRAYYAIFNELDAWIHLVIPRGSAKSPHEELYNDLQDTEDREVRAFAHEVHSHHQARLKADYLRKDPRWRCGAREAAYYVDLARDLLDKWDGLRATAGACVPRIQANRALRRGIRR